MRFDDLKDSKDLKVPKDLTPHNLIVNKLTRYK